jgi:uncharacterized protein YkwD
MKNSISITLISTLLLSGCGSGEPPSIEKEIISEETKSDTSETTKEKKEEEIFPTNKTGNENTNNKEGNNDYIKYIDINTEKEALDFINYFRRNAGLHEFKSNNNLNLSSKNHAKYIEETEDISHVETLVSAENYTGEFPNNRTIYANFNNHYISENLSYGNNNYYTSIENLFSAIYHRFGFMDITRDLIGIGAENKTFVYNMGNSLLIEQCKKELPIFSNQYIDTLCKEEGLKVDVVNFENSLYNSFSSKDVEYILFPFNNQTYTPVLFTEEEPDPLPNYSNTGFPISIEFNKVKYEGKIQKESFKLYENCNKNEEVTRIIDMDVSNDPNNIFINTQFALFPLDVLTNSIEYCAEFIYYDKTEAEKSEYKVIEWKFETK